MEIFIIKYYITEFEKRNKFFEKNEMYKARKETIERVFADAKEQRGLRYTRYTGLAQVTNWVKLKFAAMNLKKYAKWVWRDTYPDCFSCIISLVSHFSEQTPVLFDAELGFVDTLNPISEQEMGFFIHRNGYIKFRTFFRISRISKALFP